MQELYLELIGSMDQGMFAKTLTDAEANFHHILLPSSSNKTKVSVPEISPVIMFKFIYLLLK
jgi:hypothetical protein